MTRFQLDQAAELREQERREEESQLNALRRAKETWELGSKVVQATVPLLKKVIL